MNNETQICPTCKQRIDPGAGYRLLSIGEIRTVGDEFYDRGQWRSIRNVWLTRALRTNSAPTRRKSSVAEPGEGYRFLSIGEIRIASDEACYRLLAPNEILEVGDELFSPFENQWEKFFPQTVGMPLCYGITARRRVSPRPIYRLLKVGEIRQAGDEFLNGGKWCGPTLDVGIPVFEASFTYRRKLEIPVTAKPDPGAGYRLLAVGEVRQRGDEYFVLGKWGNTTLDVGMPVFEASLPYRRKIIPKQYRLLSVGEIIQFGDEVWDYKWKPARLGVHSKHDAPIRREIDSYVGGPA